MTASETIMWNELRRKKIKGLRFRRQHPIKNFIVDFYCHEKRLVIEIDGGIHNHIEIRERDEGRTMELEILGLKVVRFTNEEVQNNLSSVLKTINCFCGDYPLQR
jgi:very-short-patch-repair endonuclease